ncbi:MAG: hypothetical protein AUK23_07570 [Deltaproteobacteria bacterium CG2_30_43_15]|nr:MAG: hypothetical protein AUK23_07570 [Deltaproteobacteria bacterium CG2_30_43_15]
MIFLYREVLKRPLEGRINAVRSFKKQRLPIVMSREETQRVLNGMSGTTQLMAKLLHGSGLRLMECLRLRVKDIDFEINEIRVYSGKGGKDRLAPFPEEQIPLEKLLYLWYLKSCRLFKLPEDSRWKTDTTPTR